PWRSDEAAQDHVAVARFHRRERGFEVRAERAPDPGAQVHRRLDVEQAATVVRGGEAYLLMRQRQPLHDIQAAPELGRRLLEEAAARRNVEKEVAHLDERALRTTRFTRARQLRAFALDAVAGRGPRLAREDRAARDRAHR